MLGITNIFNRGAAKQPDGRPWGSVLTTSTEPMRPLVVKNLDEQQSSEYILENDEHKKQRDAFLKAFENVSMNGVDDDERSDMIGEVKRILKVLRKENKLIAQSDDVKDIWKVIAERISQEANLEEGTKGLLDALVEKIVASVAVTSKKENKVVNLELNKKLSDAVNEGESFYGTYEEKISEIFSKSEFASDKEKNEMVGARMTTIMANWNDMVERYEDNGERSDELLAGFKELRKNADELLMEISTWKEGENELNEFLEKDENKNWKDILIKAKSKILDPGKTLEGFKGENPGKTLHESFAFDLREKIDEYLQQSDEHVDAFHADEVRLFKKVLAAAKRIKSSTPLVHIILDGMTYGVDNAVIKGVKGKSADEAESDEKEIERTKHSRSGAEITLARIDNFEELNEPTLKEGDEKFLAKTRELWKEFAVHGFLIKDKEGKPLLNTETDLDGKCCLALLKKAGFNIDDLQYVNQGAFAQDKINIDTGGKDGVVVDRNVNDGAAGWEKTAYIDHHAKESKSRSSATFHMHKMLVDMGLLEDSPQIKRMVHFVTRIDSGEYPGIKKYFENSWKTVSGLERFMSRDDLMKFFLEDSDPDPTRSLSEEDLKKYGFIGTDKDGKDINRSKQQEVIADLAKVRLEQMKKWGFIVPSERYGSIAVSVENVIEKRMGKKNLPGDFIAARAFGCDTLVIWNAKENRFKISSSRLIADEYPQGLKVREKMWIKSIDDDSKLTFTLEEMLKKMTDGKFVPEGKLKEYIEKGTIIVDEKNEKAGKAEKGESREVPVIESEKPKEKTPNELYDEANKEAYGELSIEEFQFLKNERKKTLIERGLNDDDAEVGANKQIKKDVEFFIQRYGGKRDEKLEKVVQYILDNLK